MLLLAVNAQKACLFALAHGHLLLHLQQQWLQQQQQQELQLGCGPAAVSV
jgi:hypothetical protein